MRAILLALLLAVMPACATEQISTPVTAFTGDDPQVELLGAVELSSKVGDVSIHGLSALAWDEDEGILYALSDRARLFHFKPQFEGERLAAVDLLASYPLRDKDGGKLKGKERDSEGMHVIDGNNGKQGDSELLISFEQQPRIHRFSIEGRRTGKIKLPKVLRKVKNYSAPNNALEAVTLHPEYGVLTIPQRPLDQGHFLHASDGRQWTYTMAPVAGNEVVSMEVMPDGSLLIMERAFAPGLFPKLSVTFREGVIEGNTLTLKTLAQLDAGSGWSLDNFEGLTRVGENRFFIVSDDNAKHYQRNLLYFFRLP